MRPRELHNRHPLPHPSPGPKINPRDPPNPLHIDNGTDLEIPRRDVVDVPRNDFVQFVGVGGPHAHGDDVFVFGGGGAWVLAPEAAEDEGCTKTVSAQLSELERRKGKKRRGEVGRGRTVIIPIVRSSLDRKPASHATFPRLAGVEASAAALGDGQVRLRAGGMAGVKVNGRDVGNLDLGFLGKRLAGQARDGPLLRGDLEVGHPVGTGDVGLGGKDGGVGLDVRGWG